MGRTLEALGRREVITVNGVHHGGFDSFVSSHLPEACTPKERRIFGLADLEEVVGTVPDCEQMSGAQVIATLGRINVAYAATGLLWGDPNPIQEIYLRLNRRVQKDNLWGDPKDTAFSPIVAAQAAIKE